MILSDVDLRELVDRGCVEGLTDLDVQIQPASIDLRLDDWFVTFPFKPSEPIRIDNIDVLTHCQRHIVGTGGIDLAPGQFCLAQTQEVVHMPDDMAASVVGRSTFGRLGLAVHVTAGFIDPGFHGNITLELCNLGFSTLTLVPGTRICQIVVQELSGRADSPYGKTRGSSYQGQSSPSLPPNGVRD